MDIDVLYIGEKSKEMYFKNDCDNTKLVCETVIKIEFDNKLVSKILNMQPKEIILDADCILDEGVHSASVLSDIKSATQAKVIIIARGYQKESILIKRFMMAGIKYFVLSPIVGKGREEYRSCKNGIIPEVDMSDIQESYYAQMADDIVNNNTETEKKRKTISIAVCSGMSRMGSTTLALQIAKFFTIEGYKTCYLEQNNTNFLKSIKQTYTCEMDDTMKKINLSKLDMYYDLSLLKKIQKEGYEVMIYDYGEVGSSDIVSLLEKDFLFCTLGIKNKEIDSAAEIIRYFVHNDDGNIFYVYNFVHSSMEEQVKTMMGKNKGNTYFMSYAPEMFVLEEKNHKMLSTIFVESSTSVKKKKRFWKRG